MKMKKLLSLLLAGTMLLSMAACGASESGGGTNPEDIGHAPVSAPPSYAAYEVAKAELPSLPEKPNYADVEKAIDALDVAVLGENGVNKETQKLMDEFYKDLEAYENAVSELKGDGINQKYANPMSQYTTKTANAIFGENNGKNVAYSPANLYLALCMLCETTDGASRGQVMDLLGLKSIDDVRALSGELWRNLYLEEDGSKTLLANSMWLNETIPFKPATLDRLAKDYYASGFSVPMGAEETDKAIQAWVNEHTGGLLKDAAGGIKTDAKTVLSLISTIYFKDGWCDRFDEYATQDDKFTNADGKKAEVPFMHLTQDHAAYFHSNEGYTMAELAMESGAKMRFLLPDEGTSLKSLVAEGKVAGGLLSYDMGIDLPLGKIKWSVPKFDVNSDLDMIETMRGLGVSDIFDDSKADFSPLADTADPMVVSSIQHAGRVKIDENGCEAAAFTNIMVGLTALPPQNIKEIEMNLNRPFAFMITGTDGMPLFMGLVNEM